MNAEENVEFFDEAALLLRQAGFTPLPVADDVMPVNWRDAPFCQITTEGEIRYEVTATEDQTTIDARNHVLSITRTAAQYMLLMGQAPQLKASSLEGDYRALAEFNNVVLAGHQTRFGMEFVTWEWVQNHTSLWQGHYYGDNYTAAKRDFATRSGLLPPEQLFSDQQLAEMYRCIHETLESSYSLSSEREKLLSDAISQIERAVPRLNELVQKSNEAELIIQGQMDPPGMTQQI